MGLWNIGVPGVGKICFGGRGDSPRGGADSCHWGEGSDCGLSEDVLRLAGRMGSYMRGDGVGRGRGGGGDICCGMGGAGGPYRGGGGGGA